MKTAVYQGKKTISLEEVPDPTIEQQTDAIVDIEYAGVCGSDLWTYRGMGAAAPSRIGHEFVGIVRQVGDAVTSVKPGDWVMVPFRWSDGICRYCKKGLETSCPNGGFWSREIPYAGQAQAARIPFADGTLVKAYPDGHRPDDHFIPSLLTLTDVFTTGYHAAVSAGVGKGDTVVVVGDGAVGLSAIHSARLLGAAHVINAGSTHAERNALAMRFGADGVISERGDAAVERVRELTGGSMADKVLECVGSAQSFRTALALVAPGGAVGYVGLPHGVTIDVRDLFFSNIRIAGGMSPAHHYIAPLLPEVLSGAIEPGLVYNATYPLERIAQAYDDMDNRRVIKPLIAVR